MVGGLVMQNPAPLPWLPLRQELNLFPGPEDYQGGPTWVMQDPASQRFFRFDWPSLEMLRRWHLGDADDIAAAINLDTTLHISGDDVRAFQRKIHGWELLQVTDPGLRKHWSSRPAGATGWRWLLQHYLFFRVPLLRPQQWLDRWGSQFGFLFRSPFWICTLLAALVGLYLTSQQWNTFLSTFSAYADWRGALYLFFALGAVKILHEFGHAITTHRYGCRVATMGVAFLVMWPVLYTDTSESWTLRSRRQRLIIGAAGMAAEIAIAAWATLAWHMAPEGPLKTSLFFLSTTAWVMSLAINLNPFMRFDGYFLLSDALDRPNLHTRAFQLGRWWLRTHLWGIPEALPEAMPAHSRNAMILFAFGTWIYRFFLFLGIALLVYHMFFKALGVLLMLVELWVFIIKPVLNELLAWWQQRHHMYGVRRWRTFIVLGILVLPILIPWSTTLRLPATHGAAMEREIFVPTDAQLKHMAVSEGQWVKTGDLLAQLESPALEQALQQARMERDLIRWQLQRQGFEADWLSMGQSLTRRLEESLAREQSLLAEMQLLTVLAPTDGQVVDVESGLRTDSWLAKDSFMLRLIDPAQFSVRAWVAEDELGRIDNKALARFVPEAPELPSIRCAISLIDTGGTPALNELLVASEFGGALPVRRNGETWVPEGAWYKIQVSPCEGLGPIHRVRGTLQVVASAESLLVAASRRAWAILVRESGWGF